VYVSDFYIPRISPLYLFPCSRIGRPILEIYINLSQIYKCRNWETEHYNSVLETTFSFLGIHKWEPDIYIGFSPDPSFAGAGCALHGYYQILASQSVFMI
jgi:hypothetical protein